MTIRIVIADDQAMVRQGFAALLGAQPDMAVIGQAENGEQAVAMAKRLMPDIVLMDVRMPIMDGLTATRRLLNSEIDANRRPRVVMLTTFDLDDYVFEALRSGASGFLLKDATADDLASAVRVVAQGEALLAPTVTRRLIEEFAKRAPKQTARRKTLEELTGRETEVLELIARGLSNNEIAQSLVVAEQTVKTHVSRIFAKLGLRDRAQAVVAAYESGLARPEDSDL